MDYSKIRLLMAQRNFSDSRMAKEIGMSQPGWVSTMERETLSVKNLEKISNVFKVPVSYFFGREEEQNKPCRECEKIEAKLELLKELLDEKDKEIARLNQQLGRNVGTEDGKVA